MITQSRMHTNTMFAICATRLNELRSLAPIEYRVRVQESSRWVADSAICCRLFPPFSSRIKPHRCSNRPVLEAWIAGAKLASQPTFFQHVVTRAEYQEGGSNACRRKFPSWMSTVQYELSEEHEDTARRGKERGKARGKPKGSQNNDDEGARKPVRGSRTRTISTNKNDK